MAARTIVAGCLHCGLPLDGEGPFCCAGCRAVYALLTSGGLEQYYALRGVRGVPVPDAHVERRDVKWLEGIARQVRDAKGIARVDLDVQGLHCTACVWLIDTLFRRRPRG